VHTRFIAHPSKNPVLIVVFVATLVVSFFVLAPAAVACPPPTGTVTIHKVATDDTPPLGTFDVALVGTTAAGQDFYAEVEVPANGSTTITEVPLGTYGIIELNAPIGATVVPDEVTITAENCGDVIDVFVTNPAGKLAITKVETGQTAPDGTYTFDITGPGEYTATATVAAGTTWTSNWLPLGDYTVTERNAPTGATLTPNNGVVTLTEDEATVTVTATNPYRDFHGKLAITKVVVDPADKAETFTMRVTGPNLDINVGVKGGTTWTSGWLPLGTYTVTEIDAPTGATITPNKGVVTLNVDEATVTITVTNPSVASAAPIPATGGGLGVLPLVASVLVAAGLVLVTAARIRRRTT
jgi:uncharacterized surface anchored protein